MGHTISAVVLRGPYDAKFASVFDLRAIHLNDELTLFPLSASYVDHWAERLGKTGFESEEPLYNATVVHHMLRVIAPESMWALIQTDYFGGEGTQSAVVYQGARIVMMPETAKRGPINKALRLLGVVRGWLHDEFDTVGLGHFRRFDGLFEDYDDD